MILRDILTTKHIFKPTHACTERIQRTESHRAHTPSHTRKRHPIQKKKLNCGREMCVKNEEVENDSAQVHSLQN